MRSEKLWMPVVFTLVLLWILPCGVSFGDDYGPRLQVTVRDATGAPMTVADRVRMTDAAPFGIQSIRSPRTDDEGKVFFGPQDFEGFVLSGVNKDGEEQTKTYEGRGSLREGYFNVKLTLDIDGYPTREQTVQVPVYEPMNYDLSMNNY